MFYITNSVELLPQIFCAFLLVSLACWMTWGFMGNCQYWQRHVFNFKAQLSFYKQFKNMSLKRKYTCCWVNFTKVGWKLKIVLEWVDPVKLSWQSKELATNFKSRYLWGINSLVVLFCVPTIWFIILCCIYPNHLQLQLCRYHSVKQHKLYILKNIGRLSCRHLMQYSWIYIALVTFKML